MLYVANPSTPRVREAMSAGLLAAMTTPAQGNTVPAGAWWAADNGVFGKGYPGDDAWWAWVSRLTADPARCLFVTAPDVVGDAAATLERSAPWLSRVRGLGLPVALVAQDGLEDLPVPWDAFDVLFIGGSTTWKLSAAAAALVREAKGRGKRVHCGRVNSRKRFAYAESLGCDTADGTFLAFGPDVLLDECLSWSGPPQPVGHSWRRHRAGEDCGPCPGRWKPGAAKAGTATLATPGPPLRSERTAP